jgi:hypothetical protein
MNYTTLTASKSTAGSIRYWINHAEIDVDQILEDAQALLWQTLRTREMRSAFADLSMSVGDSTKALPTGFLDPIGLWDITNNMRFGGPKTEEQLQNRRTYTSAVLDSGTPGYYAIFDELLQFDSKFSAATTLKLIGFKSLTLLSSGNTTNFLTNRYPHILRTACMAMAHNFRNNDEREQKEMTKLAAYIAKANAESELSYRGLELDS